MHSTLPMPSCAPWSHGRCLGFLLSKIEKEGPDTEAKIRRIETSQEHKKTEDIATAMNDTKESKMKRKALPGLENEDCA